MATASPFEEFLNNIPRVTRYWLLSALLATALTATGAMDPMRLVFIPTDIFYKLQVWRLVTPFCFMGPLGLPLLMNLFFLVRYGSEYEKNPFVTTRGAFVGGTVDFVFALLCCGVVLIVLAFFLNLYVMSTTLSFAVLYLWSRKNPERPVNLWGFPLKGVYLPWAFTALTTLMGGSPFKDLLGIFVGHCFFFTVEVVPRVYGYDVLKTPIWLIQAVDYLTSENTVYATPRGARVVRPQPAAAGHSWGTGRALGAD